MSTDTPIHVPDVAPIFLTLENAVAGRLTLDRFQIETVSDLIRHLTMRLQTAIERGISAEDKGKP